MSDKECLTYTTKYARIHFTGETVTCMCCPCFETYARKQCRLTGEYIADGHLKGYWCPLLDKNLVTDKGELLDD